MYINVFLLFRFLNFLFFLLKIVTVLVLINLYFSFNLSNFNFNLNFSNINYNNYIKLNSLEFLSNFNTIFLLRINRFKINKKKKCCALNGSLIQIRFFRTSPNNRFDWTEIGRAFVERFTSCFSLFPSLFKERNSDNTSSLNSNIELHSINNSTHKLEQAVQTESTKISKEQGVQALSEVSKNDVAIQTELELSECDRSFFSKEQ